MKITFLVHDEPGSLARRLVEAGPVAPVALGLVPQLLEALLALGPLQHQPPPVQVSAVHQAAERGRHSSS